MPVILVGLYAVQRPRSSYFGLLGGILYGFAFIYFAHTTMYALAASVNTYEQLWAQLGWIYTFHGALMILGGGMFGIDTVRAGVLPSWAARLFLIGIVVNLVVALLPVPDLLQTIGTTIRNVGLIGMGLGLILRRNAQ